ncbi:GspH/FimT family pseudopilin [Dyella koreensis]|uniref:Type II secretion system protein H n=1 Tax=Dyella koreensis TaxID=311235 RepID=A0ABW8K842_9GAMM
MMGHARAGFTLIEMLVSLAVLGTLLLLGVPPFRQWLRNTHIRTAAESIQNGLRYARVEASSRGAPVRFEFQSSGADWTVCVLASTPSCDKAQEASADNMLQRFVAAGGAQEVYPSASTSVGDVSIALTDMIRAGAGVTFNALGRPLDWGATAIQRVDANTARADGRRLVILISAGGMTRLCDPALRITTNPQGCL